MAESSPQHITALAQALTWNGCALRMWANVTKASGSILESV